MRRLLIFATLVPSLALAQTTKPQFVPPNGLPLNTPLGPARNADGTGVITFATMQAGIASAVTPTQLESALTPYLKSEIAASTYTTSSYVDTAIQNETTRAKNAEQKNADDIASLTVASVTRSDLTTALSVYLTQAQSDARYATPTNIADAVQSEADRAKSAEQKNANDISAIRSVYVTTDTLTSTLSGYTTVDALTYALAPYQTQTQAAETYLPKAGGAITGDITATPDFWGATAHFGGKSLYGQFSGPFNDLGQGTALAWNELNGIPGAVLYGETDFYNLHGTGSGGFTFCDGGTAAECKSNIVLSITSGGAAWLRSLTLAGSTGAGNGFACLDGTGKLYRDSSAPCVTSYVDPKYATPQAVTDAVQAETGRAEATYLPKAGGTVQDLAISASFTPPKMTYEQATASTCTVGTIYYITNGQKFWSAASFTGAPNAPVLIASDTGQEGGFYGCVPNGPEQVQLLPLVMNYNGGAR